MRCNQLDPRSSHLEIGSADLDTISTASLTGESPRTAARKAAEEAVATRGDHLQFDLLKEAPRHKSNSSHPLGLLRAHNKESNGEEHTIGIGSLFGGALAGAAWPR